VGRDGTSWTPGALGWERGTPRCAPGHSLCDEFRSLLGRANHWNGSWARWSTGIRNDYGSVRRSGNTARWTVWRLRKGWPLRDPEATAGPLPPHVSSDRSRPACRTRGLLPGHPGAERSSSDRGRRRSARGGVAVHCLGYRIEVSNKPTFDTSTCVSPSYGCPIGAWTIGPGEVRHDKVLLNYVHDLSTPGLYDIRASRTLTFGPPADFVSQISGPQLKAEEQFHIRVNDEGSQDLLSMFQPFLEALDSKDEEHQQEAARVIGSLAPPFLEAKILDMAASPKTRRFALLGLRRLNTTRSRKALADVVL